MERYMPFFLLSSELGWELEFEIVWKWSGVE
jgi:hypothetical protein